MATTREVTIPELVAWAKSTSGPLLSVADVGATNTRYSVVTDTVTRDTVLFVKRQAGSVAALVSLFSDIQTALGHETCARIAAGSIAVPGPVPDGVSAVLANFESPDTEGRTVRVSLLPPEIFPHSKTLLLNDLESAAFGVLGLAAGKSLHTIFRQLWAAQGKPSSDGAMVPLSGLPAGNVAIVAPGTGLGSASLLYNPSTKHFSVLPLEFGHTTVPNLDYPDFITFISKKLGFAVEHDDLCSGRGLEYLYMYFTKTNEPSLKAAEISKRAKAGSDEAAVKAMHAYHDYVVGYCSQLTMGLQTKLIIVAGDNTINNGWYFEDPKNIDRLYDRLMAHSMERMGFMSRTTFAIQNKRTNLNIAGCMYAAHLAAHRPTPAASKL